MPPDDNRRRQASGSSSRSTRTTTRRLSATRQHEAQSSLALATTRVPEYTPGAGDSGTKADLDRLLALPKEVLPQLVLRTIGGLEEEDLAFDYGYVYRAEGGT